MQATCRNSPHKQWPGRCSHHQTGPRESTSEEQIPHGQTTELSRGKITNPDEIAVVLVEPADGTRPLVRVNWPLRPTTAAATHYPIVAAAIVRIIAESATALTRYRAGGQR